MIDLKALYEKDPDCFRNRISLEEKLRKEVAANAEEIEAILAIYDGGASRALECGNNLPENITELFPAEASKAWWEVLALVSDCKHRTDEITNHGMQLCIENRFAEAIPILEEAAKAGSVDAAYRLGELYSDGKGVPVNMQNAFLYFRQAADCGDALAAFNTAMMLENGDGVVCDPNQAFIYCKKAAEAGVKFARFDLGRMYENGIGTEKDYIAAAGWYRKAAKQGIKTATVALDRLKTVKLHSDANEQKELETSQVSTVDPMEWVANGRCLLENKQYMEAFSAFRHAARHGSSEASFLLGQMYEKGQGTEIDISAALRYYHQAAERGLAKATEAAERLKKSQIIHTPEVKRSNVKSEPGKLDKNNKNVHKSQTTPSSSTTIPTEHYPVPKKKKDDSFTDDRSKKETERFNNFIKEIEENYRDSDYDKYEQKLSTFRQVDASEIERAKKILSGEKEKYKRREYKWHQEAKRNICISTILLTIVICGIIHFVLHRLEFQTFGLFCYMFVLVVLNFIVCGLVDDCYDPQLSTIVGIYINISIICFIPIAWMLLRWIRLLLMGFLITLF